MQIEINSGKFEVDEKLIKKAIQKTFQKLEIINKVAEQRDIEISVAIISKEKIREINKQWRNKDEETDVLSFCYEDTKEKLEGEVVLCLDIIQENARKDSIEEEEELRKNIIHSILHIVGYKHGEEMFGLQAEMVLLGGGEFNKYKKQTQ